VTLPRRIPKSPKRATRWRSRAHTTHVRGFACCNCGSITNIEAAHVRIGSDAGYGQKPDDWRTVPLCSGPFSGVGATLGCHQVQHAKGEKTFWREYERSHGQSVWQLIDELCAASPKAAEIRRVRQEREAA
jgi:hypothetical protein